MRSHPLRILIVEDDLVAGQTLARLLRHNGHEVELAGCLAVADALVANAPDVILLDMMLPDGIGSTLIPKVREAGILARVILTTGMSDRRKLADALAMGAEAVLMKPIDFGKLLEML